MGSGCAVALCYRVECGGVVRVCGVRRRGVCGVWVCTISGVVVCVHVRGVVRAGGYGGEHVRGSRVLPLRVCRVAVATICGGACQPQKAKVPVRPSNALGHSRGAGRGCVRVVTP